MAARTRPVGRALTRRVRWLAWLGAGLIALTLAPGSATATLADHFRFSGPYDYVFWDCGYAMHVVGTETHVVTFRVDKKIDDYIYVTDNYAYQETWTTDDGRRVSAAGNGVAKDVKATLVEGTVYEFTFHNSGIPFSISDPSGRILYRDRGTFSLDYTFDITDPDNTWTFVGARFSGPHPLADLDACRVVQPFTGSNSADYLTERPIGSTDSPAGYDEYLPPSYTATGAKSPLLIFFHGYGETGDGTPEAISRLVAAGIPRYISVGGWDTSRPFVVLAPQHVEDPPGFDFSSCDGAPFGGSCNMQVQHDLGNVQPAFCTTPDEVHDFIDYAIAHYNVDPTRVYVTGLSCGAFGIWEYLAKYGAGAKAAAAVPIAGDGRPGSSSDYCALAATPLWAFHGALDDVVDPLGSIEPLEALQACPGVPAGSALLTVFPDRDHNSWDPAYGGAAGDIYDWMLGFTNP